MKNPWKLAFFSLILLIGIGAAAYYLGKTGILSINLPKTSPTSSSVPSTTSQKTPIATQIGASDETLIKQALYKKFGLDETKLNVTINQLTAKHAKGLVKEVDAVGGGYFIAAKASSGWVIIYDGQANPTCAQIEPYGFPKDMVPECLNASGAPVTR